MNSMYPDQTAEKTVAVDAAVLRDVVKGFAPDEIGLSRAWHEFYMACLAADAPSSLLQAIHDIMESIEDAEKGMVQ